MLWEMEQKARILELNESMKIREPKLGVCESEFHRLVAEVCRLFRSVIGHSVEV